MTQLASRLIDRLGTERVLVEPDALTAYECDGFTVNKSRPAAVALPDSTADVVDIVGICNDLGMPFLARGAGTCLSGGPTPIGPAVVIETARMRRVLEVSTADRFAIVQPGVVNLALTRAVQDRDLHYAPDPSSQAVCTIGGNLAENAGGPHCFKYGMTTDHLLGATVVLPDGDVVVLGGPEGPRGPHELDLLGLFVGSEGTFGIATEIVVRLSQDPEGIRTLLASFAGLEPACQAVSDIVSAGIVPAALEILDQSTIRAVEASVFRAGYPQDAAAVLLVELDGPAIGLDDDAAAIEAVFANNGAIHSEQATDPAERARLWKGRKGAFGAMGRLRPDLYVLDGVVPRTKLVETLRTIVGIGEKYDLTLSNVFHAGDGNLHPNISFDGRDPEETERVKKAGYEILETCVRAGGSITGEHGVGSEKLEHMPLMFDAADLDVMARIRSVFDPERRCNPGKVIPERASCVEVARWPQMVERVLAEEGP